MPYTVLPRPLTAADIAAGVGVAALPGTADQGVGDAGVVWAPIDLFRPEWSSPVELTHAFSTIVTPSLSGAEARRARAAAPSRLLAYESGLLPLDEPTAAWAAMLRAAHALNLTPLWCEQSPLTSAASPNFSDQRLNLVTADRLIYPGARLVVIAPVGQRYGRGPGSVSLTPGAFDIVTIRASGSPAPVQATQVRVVEALSRTYPAGSMVVPLMEAEPVAESGADWGGAQGTLPFGRVAWRSAAASLSASPLPALQDDGQWPSGAQTYDGLPVWDCWPDLAQGQSLGARRDVLREAIGASSAPALALRGDRAVLTHSLSFVEFSRASARRPLRWFEALRGSSRALWLPSPRWRLRLALASGQTSISGSTITVIDTASALRSLPLPWRPDRIAIVRWSAGARVIECRRVTQIASTTVNGAAAEELTLDSPLPSIQVSAVDRVCWLIRSRLAGEEIRESWITTGAARTSLRFVEAINEQAIDLSIPAACSPSTAGSCGCSSSGPGAAQACSGSPLRRGPLDLAAGAPAAACPLSPDGYVIDTSGQLRIRVKASFSGTHYDSCGFPPTQRVSAWCTGTIDDEIVLTPTSAHSVQVTNRLVAGTFVHQTYNLCTGPTILTFGGTSGVLRASVWWRHDGRRRLRLEVGGYLTSGATDPLIYLLCDIDDTGVASFSVAFNFPGLQIFPSSGQATADLAQPAGVTSLRASYRAVSSSPRYDVAMASYCHLCSILRCA